MFKKTFLLLALFAFLFASETSFSSNEDLTLIGNKAASESQSYYDPQIDLPDSMWIMIDSVYARNMFQGIHVEGDTIYCSLQGSSTVPYQVEKRDRLTGALLDSFPTSTGTNISIVRFGDSICISKLTTPERCEVYTLGGTYVRQFQPSGGQQIRGLEWDGDKFWGSTYTSGALHIYTMTRTGTVLKDLVQSGGVITPTIGRDLALDRMYPNRLWTIPYAGSTTPGAVIYIAFDTIANTFTPLVHYISTGQPYHSGIAFYTDPVIGGCVYTYSWVSLYIWRHKVHEPTAPMFSVLPTNIDFGDVAVGASKQDSVEVTNPGAATLNVTNVVSDNTEFTVNPTSGSIAPAANMWFYITFTPTSAGAQSGNIEFTHDAVSSPDTVTVTGNGVAGGGGNWEAMTDIPAAPSGKNPKSGSCMQGLDATGLIYFLKASNKPDFYAYDPVTNTWAEKETIPKGEKGTDYSDGKYPKRGAAMAAYEPGKCVYVVRGNNRLGFWKYQCDTLDTLIPGWRKKATIPAGAKRCKYGTGLTLVEKGGEDYLFLMKGAKTSEFYLYDIESDTWGQTSSPPVGASGKTGYKKGSIQAYDGSGNVYVLQGYYGSFFKYHVEGDSWTQLSQYNYKLMRNRDGKKKKFKDGASMVYYNDVAYCLKGGNTVEIWKYTVASDSWTQMPENWDVPLGPTGRKKVKDGGAMIKFGDFFWASKGKNTPEFYRHVLPADAPAMISYQPTDEGTMGKRVNLADFNLTIAPNPATNLTTIKYNLPVSGPVTFKLYNITGTLVKSHTITNPTKEGVLTLDAKSLPAGVYMLRFNSGNIRVTRKLVLEK